MKPENLINWGELSRLLAGSRSVITKKRIGKKHEKPIKTITNQLKHTTMEGKIIIENCLLLPLLDNDKMEEVLIEFNGIISVLLNRETPLSTKHFFVYKGGHHFAVHQIVSDEIEQDRIIFYEF